MTNTNSPITSSLKIFSFLAILLFLCYANTFQVPWQLDDAPNITANYLLHITDLQPETLWQTFFAQPFAEGKLYRPIPNLSFALNWYLGQTNPFGYHLVNLFIHFISAFFLFRCVFLLLITPAQDKFAEKDAYAIALLSVVLWSIHPIQTQAVTYIVQRMASMAGMFFVIAIYHFISARQSSVRVSIIKHFFFCAFFFLLAVGCKENAITLIPSLLLIEFIFFPKKRSPNIFRVLVAANICLFAAAGFYIIELNYFDSLTNPIGSRPFSLLERLLTQPSVLLFYLSLLFAPSPTRLSIDHSFPLSTSLLHPWSTLPAIICILFLLIFAVWRCRKNSLLSFSILFFFINHIVESSVIPLELIFEHRNYIPSFFLFLPISAGLVFLLNRFAATSRLLHVVILATIPLILIIIGLATYSRNAVWLSEESLWADTLSKAPNNARPFAKLGEIYGWQKEKNPKNLQISIALLLKALDRESPRTSFKAAIVGNIGKVYRNYGMLDLAIEYYNKSLQLNPGFIDSRYDLAQALTLQGKFAQALEQIDRVITQNDLQSRFFDLKVLILLWLDRPKEAADCSNQAIHKTIVNKERYFYNAGVALSRAGHRKQGEWFLKRALYHLPNDTRVLCSLIENRLLADDTDAARRYTLQLLDRKGIVSLNNYLESLRVEYSAVPINVDLISPIISELAQSTVAKLNMHETTKNESSM